jgi:hypothetical protein
VLRGLGSKQRPGTGQVTPTQFLTAGPGERERGAPPRVAPSLEFSGAGRIAESSPTDGKLNMTRGRINLPGVKGSAAAHPLPGEPFRP